MCSRYLNSPMWVTQEPVVVQSCSAVHAWIKAFQKERPLPSGRGPISCTSDSTPDSMFRKCIGWSAQKKRVKSNLLGQIRTICSSFRFRISRNLHFRWICKWFLNLEFRSGANSNWTFSEICKWSRFHLAIDVPRLSQDVVLNGKIIQAGLINDINEVEISCLW